jgi:hypothetical protein
MKFMTFLAALFVAGAAVLFAQYGTLSPCGMLRETARKQGGAVAAVLPDAVIDVALASRYGPLTPAKCVSLLIRNYAGSPSTPAPGTAPSTNAAPVAVVDERGSGSGGETKFYSYRSRQIRT